MSHDISRLANDINTIVNTLYPETDMIKFSIRMEEILSNYEIQRKSLIEIEEDIDEKVELYLSAMKLEGFSSSTLKSYRGELSLFAGHCSKAVVQITTTDIRSYLSSLEGIMMSTISTKLAILKSFFSWMVREEILLRNPTSKIRTPKTPSRLPKALSIEELEIVRESCKTLREKSVIEVLYSTGVRLSELTSMKIADVNFQTMSLKVIGKGNKERIVYLSFKAIYHLRKYLSSRTDQCEYLFVTLRKPIRQAGNRAIQREIGNIEERANISQNLTPHVFRHSLATNMINNGADLADIQQILGHQNPESTLIYAQVSEERKQQAHRRYHVQ